MFLRYTPSVFFSHSKHDRNLIDYFSKIFAFIGLRGIFFEWQQLPPNYAGLTISEYIRDPDTVAVFVLMGINVLRPPTRTPQYTHNWVSFEVGTASGNRFGSSNNLAHSSHIRFLLLQIMHNIRLKIFNTCNTMEQSFKIEFSIKHKGFHLLQDSSVSMRIVVRYTTVGA